MSIRKRKLLRIIVPAFSNFNIYTGIARITTALGPVIVATIANKLAGWDVEVIDENNTRRLCPKDHLGRPDHAVLQHERPADVVGFYGSLTSTIPRIFELAALYKSWGVTTIAGGKHVEALPEEALHHNIDMVVMGEGERVITKLLEAVEQDAHRQVIPGIAYLGADGSMILTQRPPLITDFDEWPFPDFKLVRYAKIKIFPTCGTRGCNSKCEFCSVRDRTRCATPQRMIDQIAYLVEVHGARIFFESSDHFAADPERAIEFCHLLANYQKEKGVRLSITVQIRLTDARNKALLQAMREARINNICIGIESPINEELKAMHKGYTTKDMLGWVDTFHRFGFTIHGMFIFGYPRQDNQDSLGLSIADRVKRFQDFIHRGRIDTCQILLTIPLPGTDLRKRLEAQGRIFPLEEIGWQHYDGQFPIFVPDDDENPEELQKAVTQIMGRFYHFHHLWMVIINVLVNFPAFVIPTAVTITTFRVRYITSAFYWWKRKWWRNSVIRFGGWFVVHNWKKRFKESDFLLRLRRARQQTTGK